MNDQDTRAVGGPLDQPVGRPPLDRADLCLLTLAADAIGLEWEWHPGCDDALHLTVKDSRALYWNPLVDDGDAFRLAVTLGLRCEPMANWCVAYAGSVCAEQFSERSGNNRQAAMRRAIVRAAASMLDRKTPNARGKPRRQASA